MKQTFDKDWILHPAGGDSGQAFMGQHKQERVFLKRNSSPFLAALSTEGLTPRLVWSKRTSDGSTYSAQEWLPGRTLEDEEVRQPQVQALIRHYQQSNYLRAMLEKIGGERYRAPRLLAQLQTALAPALGSETLVLEALAYLEEEQEALQAAPLTVSHGDLCAENFYLADDGRLYLVDWDNCQLADPYLDIGQLLVHYIPLAAWADWLKAYPLAIEPQSYQRLIWYAILTLLFSINQAWEAREEEALQAHFQKLKIIYQYRSFHSVT